MTALREMHGALTDEDADLREITDSVLAKLDGMKEEEFSRLELYPDFDDRCFFSPYTLDGNVQSIRQTPNLFSSAP